jgi:hypothetical protein
MAYYIRQVPQLFLASVWISKQTTGQAIMDCDPAARWKHRRHNFRHPTLRGLPDLVMEGGDYTLELIGPGLLYLDIQLPSAMARLLTEPVKGQVAIAV